MKPLLNLKLIISDEMARSAFLASSTLADFEPEHFVLAAIIPSHPEYFAQPEPNDRSGYALKISWLATEVNYHLPAGIEYRSFRFIPDEYILRFEIVTSQKTVTTNIQEFNNLFFEIGSTEEERSAAFNSLTGFYEAPARFARKYSPITSRILGALHPSNHSEIWQDTPLALPALDGHIVNVTFIDQYMRCVDKRKIDNKKIIAAIDDALENFINIELKDHNDASQKILNVGQEFLELIGWDLTLEPKTLAEMEPKWREDYTNFHSKAGEIMAITTPSDIWKYIKAEELWIRPEPDENEHIDIDVILSCRCLWDEEHGIQLLFKNGKTLTEAGGVDP